MMPDDVGNLGTYTAEGITKLCEGLKGSSVTSLRCLPCPAPPAALAVSSSQPALRSSVTTSRNTSLRTFFAAW